ncbi:MAG: metallophosphoesterase family protein [Hyphomicrobiales bacterium]
MPRVTLVSDPHLSPTHGFFWENWRIACDAVNADEPDLVIVNGDLCINGPDSDAEMEFAGAALKALRVPVHALPGNHDVGDEPPGQDAKQLIDAARITRWNGVFGTDRFDARLGAWQLLGIDAQLCGSGLPQEADQQAWLADRLSAAEGPVALFLHKPLFLDSPDETAPTAASLNPAPRAELLRLIKAAPVRLVVSGHLHSHRDVTKDGIRYVWAPALSFVHAAHQSATPMVAALSLDFSDETPGVEIVHFPGLVAHDLKAIKQHGRYAFLRDMPPCPPAGAPPAA